MERHDCIVGMLQVPLPEEAQGLWNGKQSNYDVRRRLIVTDGAPNRAVPPFSARFRIQFAKTAVQGSS